MRIKVCIRTLAAASIPALVLVTDTVAAQPNETATLPEVKVGDAWILQGADTDVRNFKVTEWKIRREVTMVDGTVASYAAQNLPPSKPGEGKGRYDFASQVRLRDLQSGKQEPTRFPLGIGNEWKYDFAVKGSYGVVQYAMKAKVVGWEEVTVPAGKFRALRVEHEGVWSRDRDFSERMTGAASAAVSATYWYAPAAKTVVKIRWVESSSFGGESFRSESELVEFQPGK